MRTEFERMPGRWGRLAVVVLGVVAAWHSGAIAEAFPLERLDEGGYVIMLRHARAPGTGDPDDFQLGDCATQRNLDDDGREQAKSLGERLRAAGIASAVIYSSQWCRCLETAALLQLGPVAELPALNSFHQRPADRQPNLDALRAFLAGLAPEGPLVVLVTHQVTIAAITDHGAASGAAVILKAGGGVEPRVVGTIGAG
jgi:phosphohistidine phosphatase SixA